SQMTAILFLTAMGDPEHRIQGLEPGAEDYVTKPFHPQELLLRTQTAPKRATYFQQAQEDQDQVLQIGKAKVDCSRFQAEREGTAIPLSLKECSLLKLLVERRGKAVSRDDILNIVWSEEDFPSARTVDNFIVRLRRVVED